MITQHFIDPSPMGWLRISPDLQFVAVGGPGAAFRLYRDHGELLLRHALPFAFDCADVAFRLDKGICVGLAVLTSEVNPRIIIFDVTDTNVVNLHRLELAGVSAINYSNDGAKLLVGLENGVLLEYANTAEASSDYIFHCQLPVDSRVIKVLPAEEDGVYLAYNDNGQLFCVAASEVFEILAIDGSSLSLKLVKHHPALPLLAAVLHSGALIVRNLLTGMLAELALVEPSTQVISLSFTPNGDIVVATRNEVVQVSLFFYSTPEGEEAVDVRSAVLYSLAKPIVAAEVAAVGGIAKMLVLHN